MNSKILSTNVKKCIEKSMKKRKDKEKKIEKIEEKVKGMVERKEAEMLSIQEIKEENTALMRDDKLFAQRV